MFLWQQRVAHTSLGSGWWRHQHQEKKRREVLGKAFCGWFDVVLGWLVGLQPTRLRIYWRGVVSNYSRPFLITPAILLVF
jgi:hypothetical protein